MPQQPRRPFSLWQGGLVSAGSGGFAGMRWREVAGRWMALAVARWRPFGATWYARATEFSRPALDWSRQRFEDLKPVRAAVVAAYLRAADAAVAGHWRRSPGLTGSILVHSLLLIGLLLWAYPRINAGGAANAVAVEVVVTQPSTVAAVPVPSSAQPAPAPHRSSAAEASASTSKDTLEAPDSASASALSPTAAQDALPEPQSSPDAKQTSVKADAKASVADPSPSAKPAPTDGGTPTAAGSQLQALENALLGQILRCWNPAFMVGRRGLMAIDVDLVLNRDGTLARAPELSGELAVEAAHNPALRAAADSLRTAFKFCAPFKLPAEAYDQWHEIPFHFDPAGFMAAR